MDRNTPGWMNAMKTTSTDRNRNDDSDFDESLSELDIDLTNNGYNNISEVLIESFVSPTFKQEPIRTISPAGLRRRNPISEKRRGYLLTNSYADDLHTSSCSRSSTPETPSTQPLNLVPAEQTGNTHDWINLVTSLSSLEMPMTPFQYILLAATSPATKLSEETQTYLNQGQSYEIKLKKVGTISSETPQELYKSVVRVVFHERRLQYMEKEHLEFWRQTRPGERIIDIDIPLSYGLSDVNVDAQQVNNIECVWDARQESAVFVRIHCISTEFTARKHGGEKGVPFRLQIETYDGNRLVHCASCQIKVFKPKGADRKHKTDREKLEKKSEADRIPIEQVQSYLDQLERQRSDVKSFNAANHCNSPQPMNVRQRGTAVGSPRSPLNTHIRVSQTEQQMLQFTTSDGLGSFNDVVRGVGSLADQCSAELHGGPRHRVAGCQLQQNAVDGNCDADTPPTTSSLERIPPKRGKADNTNDVDSSTCLRKRSSSNHSLTDCVTSNTNSDELSSLQPSAPAADVSNWLVGRRFAKFTNSFENYSGADLLKLSRDDLIDICGPADGIRLNNALHLRNIAPVLTMYVRRQDTARQSDRHYVTTDESYSAESSTTDTTSATITPTGFASDDENSSSALYCCPSPATGHLHGPSRFAQCWPPASASWCFAGEVQTTKTPSTISKSAVVFDDQFSTAEDPLHRSDCSLDLAAVPDLFYTVGSHTPPPQTSAYLFEQNYHQPQAASNAGEKCGSRLVTFSEKHSTSKHCMKRFLSDGDVTASVGKRGRCFNGRRSSIEQEVYDAVYLENLTRQHVIVQLLSMAGLAKSQLGHVYVRTVAGVDVDLTDSVVEHFADHSKFTLEVLNADEPQKQVYNILLRMVRSFTTS